MQVITKQIEAYSFDELSGSAKDNFRFKVNSDYWDSVTAHEYKDTLNKFSKKFDISWTEFDVSPPYLEYKLNIKNEDLRQYENDGVINDVLYQLTVLKQSEDCPLTGVYTDEAILEPIRKINFTKNFCDNFYKNFDLESLLNQCINNWLKNLQLTYDYEMSDEFLSELASANDYLFTKDGKII